MSILETHPDENTALLASFSKGGATKPTQRELRYLYLAHLLQTFGDRMWSFAVPILFMNIWVDTLLPSAIFSFFLYGSVGLCMAPLGKWMDKSDRMSVMRVGVYGQNIFILLNCICFMCIVQFCGYNHTGPVVWSPLLVTLFALLLLSASIAEVCGTAASLAIEKDWVVVLYPESADLATINVTMRRIDLMCKIVAPTVFGLVVQFCTSVLMQLVVGISFAAIFNLLAMQPEYSLAKALYATKSKLRERKATADKGREKVGKGKGEGRGAWPVYLSSHVCAACFGFSALFLTVLDNGILMTAYLKWLGIPEALLGLGRGLGAVFGLLGTVVFPFLLRCMSLRQTGILTVWCFFLCVLPVALNFLDPYILMAEPSNYKSGIIMLAGVSVARIFLWAFDLAHTQVLQEEVGEDIRGQIFTCQTATYQAFWIVLYSLGIIFSHPDQFSLLTYVSVGSVLLAAVLWTAFAVVSGRRQES